MAATYESETSGVMPSNPGKPTLPCVSWIVVPLSVCIGPLGLITGATYLFPNRPLNPV